MTTQQQIQAEAERMYGNTPDFAHAMQAAYIAGANRNPWISVDSPPEPEPEQKVIVITKSGHILFGTYDNFFGRSGFVVFGICITHNITHWMPIQEIDNNGVELPFLG